MTGGCLLEKRWLIGPDKWGSHYLSDRLERRRIVWRSAWCGKLGGSERDEDTERRLENLADRSEPEDFSGCLRYRPQHIPERAQRMSKLRLILERAAGLKECAFVLFRTKIVL